MENPNPLKELDDKEKVVPYTDAEKKYAQYLQSRLEVARNQRNTTHDEFDGMSYTKYYESNLKGANSYIAPKKNKGDVLFTTGTTRQALLAYIAKLNSLNLSPEVRAFNKENKQDINVSHAIEDAIFQSNELDNDEEKRVLREYELLMQGTVFVQKSWVERFQLKKNGFNGKNWDGKVESAQWTEKLEKIFAGCTTDILPGLSVFLGRLTEFDMEKQPFNYTVNYRSWQDAEQIYSGWERWKYVSKDVRYFSDIIPQTIYNNNWRLQNTLLNTVEEIIYQDKWANEFMVILNGVMMMKPGFPMPWSYGEYNIVKQIFEIITTNFAYGGSLIKRLKVSQQLEDEFWRLAILKTQQSYDPPRGNMTGHVLSSRVFMPGKLTPGITKDMVQPLIESQGITNGEVQMLTMLKKNMNENSLPDIAQGQEPTGDPTATEIIQRKAQSNTLMQNAIFSCSMLEKKLATLTMYTLLENFFEPVETQADVAKMEIIEKYRTTSRTIPVEGYGMGRRVTRMQTKALPSPEDIYDEEEEMSEDEKQPVRLTYLNPEELKKVKYDWYIIINPREKESSELNRVLFGNMMNQAVTYFQQDLNLGHFEEKFAEAWNLNADKAFVNKGSQMLQLQPQTDQSPAGGMQAPTQGMMPKLNNQMKGQIQNAPMVK